MKAALAPQPALALSRQDRDFYILKIEARHSPLACVDFRLSFVYRFCVFNSLFEQLASVPHSFREVDGKQVHDYACLRCNLERQAAAIRERMQVFARDIEEILGEKKPSDQS